MSKDTDPQGTPPQPAARAEPGELASWLIAASHAMAGVTDLRSLAAAIAKSLSRLTVDAYSLARFRDADRSDLERLGAWDRDGNALPDRDEAAEASVPGIHALRPGEWRVYDDCQSAPDLDEDTRRALLGGGIRAYAAFPLLQRGEVTGVFCAVRRAPHVHTPEELQLLRVIAELTSVSLVNIERRDRLAGQVQLARSLYRLSEELSQMSDEAALFKVTVETLVRPIGYSGGWIGVVDEGRRGLASRATADTTNVENPLLVYDLNDKHMAQVQAFHEGRPVVVSDLLARARAEGWGEVAAAARLHSAIYVPLKVGGETVGVLGVFSTEDSVSEDEVALVSAFGNHLAGAVGRVRTEQQRAAQLERLRESYAVQARLLDVVRELSTPVYGWDLGLRKPGGGGHLFAAPPRPRDSSARLIRCPARVAPVWAREVSKGQGVTALGYLGPRPLQEARAMRRARARTRAASIGAVPAGTRASPRPRSSPEPRADAAGRQPQPPGAGRDLGGAGTEEGGPELPAKGAPAATPAP